MEWKVIFMSQVWQLSIVPSLRYCAALCPRSWVHINTHTGGSSNFVGKLVAFSPTLPVLSIFECRIRLINENCQKIENNRP